jgi:hypothetical protein
VTKTTAAVLSDTSFNKVSYPFAHYEPRCTGAKPQPTAPSHSPSPAQIVREQGRARSLARSLAGARRDCRNLEKLAHPQSSKWQGRRAAGQDLRQ